ncbi:OLC1v1014713C1 [Oldenlandia corymbosa var. corymbosa]|nr:OLC1v1014713C1 [Oldenlandia corymbosa var. corymbosa]
MEETSGKASSFRPTLSGKSTPRGSPSFRRLASGRTPRREGKSGGFNAQWVRNNRIVLWLLLITLWAYGGFYVQSRWAHGDNKEGIFGGNESDENSELFQKDEIIELKPPERRDLTEADDYLATISRVPKNESISRNSDMKLTNNGIANKTSQNVSPKKKGKRSSRGTRKKSRAKQKVMVKSEDTEVDTPEEELPSTNTTYRMLLGPFGSLEDNILEWSPEKRSGTCDRKGQFARLVWSRKFVLIFHELSMTGAPLAMMELATELLSCGATVNVVLLSKRGGLMQELARRKIKVLEDKLDVSFKTAMKADLIIAGSAVSASWIEKYKEHTVLGSSQIAWWIMENRREYFDRAKLALAYVKRLVFLSESQSKQWLAWCEEENIKLKSAPELIPLSVNDELAFVAGIPCSLNTPASSTEKMLEKRQLLRTAVRKEMGLTDNDMLVVSLSSINPGKGQFLLLESARILFESGLPSNSSVIKSSEKKSQNFRGRVLLQKGRSKRKLRKGTLRKQETIKAHGNGTTGHLLAEREKKPAQKLKVLIGSVGSKSNKVPYVKLLLKLLSEHQNMSNSVLWTPATTRVASLYAAADVYVMNAQGLGETFGRVTIEAMAFGLPV